MMVHRFTTDCVPDLVLEDILSRLDMYKFYATFFCTNAYARRKAR